MIAMGIDLGRPGAAVVLTDYTAGKPLCIARLTIPVKINDYDYQRGIARLMREHKPDIVAAERPGHWGRAIIGLSQARCDSLARASAQAMQIAYVNFEPVSVKCALGCSRTAPKDQVARAVMALVQIEPGDQHLMDAAAIALLALKGKREKPRGRRRTGSRHVGSPEMPARGKKVWHDQAESP